MSTVKQVLVLLANGAEEMEFTISVDILRRAGLQVTVAGVELDSKPFVKGSRQINLVPDIIFEQENWAPSTAKYDAVIIPGGMGGAKTLAENKSVQHLIRSWYDDKRIVAFICAGTLAAKSAGIPGHHTVTSYPSVRDQLEGVFKYSEDRVVVDENVITSRGPGTAFLFALTIVSELCGEEVSNKLKKEMLTADQL